MGGKDGPVVTSAYFFSKGPEFGTQYLVGWWLTTNYLEAQLQGLRFVREPVLMCAWCSTQAPYTDTSEKQKESQEYNLGWGLER